MATAPRVTLEQISTLCQLSISNETLGKALREMFNRGDLALMNSDNSFIGEINDQNYATDHHNFNSGALRETINESRDLDYGNHKPIIIEVKVGEKRSSVSVPIFIFKKVTELYGKESLARQHIRELALKAPSGTKKLSTWIQGQLLQHQKD